MNFKQLFLTVILLIIFFQNCGLVDIGSATGTLKLVFSENGKVNTQNKSSGVLEHVLCVVKKGSDVVFSRYLTRIENSFLTEVDNLSRGNDYSVTLYGRYGGNTYIEASANRMNISISEEKVTIVKLSWSSFIPILLYPINSEVVDNHNPLFQWNSVPGAEEYWFRIEDHPFQPGPSNINVTIDSCFILPDSLFGGTYFWTIRSLGHSNVFSQWADPDSFTI